MEKRMQHTWSEKARTRVQVGKMCTRSDNMYTYWQLTQSFPSSFSYESSYLYVNIVVIGIIWLLTGGSSFVETENSSIIWELIFVKVLRRRHAIAWLDVSFIQTLWHDDIHQRRRKKKQAK